MPALALQDGRFGPDRRSYQNIFDTFYRAFFEVRAQAVVLHPAQNFEAYPLVIVPTLYIADETLLKRLTQYAANGGHLLLTFKSGYADEYARIRWTRAPGPLRQAVGASYQEYSNLTVPIPLKPGNGDLILPADAQALGWADGLQLEGATPLAYYDHPHFGRFPAIVSQPFSKGRVTYCGTLPNPSAGAALAAWLLQQAGIQVKFPNAPTPVRINSAQATNGKKLWFFTNWSWDTQRLESLPLQGYELFSGAPVQAGSSLELDAWEVKIVVV